MNSTISIKSWKIPSSKKDNKYKVTKIDNEWTCECKGYSYRKNCSHIQYVKDMYYYLGDIVVKVIV